MCVVVVVVVVGVGVGLCVGRRYCTGLLYAGARWNRISLSYLVVDENNQMLVPNFVDHIKVDKSYISIFFNRCIFPASSGTTAACALPACYGPNLNLNLNPGVG